jgi:serine protease Do
MDDLLNEGKVVRGWLGVVIQSLDDDLAKSLGLDSKHGVVVNDLTPDGPAAKAGIRRGDVILEFQGTSIKDADHLQSLVAARDPGSSATVKIVRDGKERTVRIGLGERPLNPEQTIRGESEDNQKDEESTKATPAASLGFSVTPLTSALSRELGYSDEQGVVVEEVARGGPAATKNIRRGDLIKEVNRKPVSSVKEFEQAIKEVKPGEAVLLLLRRDQTTFFTAIKASEEKN